MFLEIKIAWISAHSFYLEYSLINKMFFILN